MALLDPGSGFPVDGPQQGQVRVVLHHPAQVGLVPAAAHLVEDETGNGQVRVEGQITQQERGQTPGHPLDIHQQQDRRPQQLGQLGVTVAAMQVRGIVEADIALNQTQVGPRHAPGEGRLDLRRRHGVVIQIQTGASRGLTEPEGIDIVRPLFEGAHPLTPVGQFPAQPDGQRRLTGGLVGGGDIETGHEC